MTARIAAYCKVVLRKISPEASDTLLLTNTKQTTDTTYDALIQECNRSLAKIAASSKNVSEVSNNFTFFFAYF
jgi:hypothetical protein